MRNEMYGTRPALTHSRFGACDPVCYLVFQADGDSLYFAIVITYYQVHMLTVVIFNF